LLRLAAEYCLAATTDEADDENRRCPANRLFDASARVVSALHFKADLTLGLGTVGFDYLGELLLVALTAPARS
jgi:hypothetical protein